MSGTLPESEPAAEAERIYFKKKGFAQSTVTFNIGKNAGLSDSSLVNPDGKELKLSSKGGLGATASVGNLLSSVDELKALGKKELAKSYADTIEILETIKSGGQHNSPIQLAQKFGIISSGEAKIVTAMRSDPDVALTKRLTKIYDSRLAQSKTEDYVPYYVMLTALAEMVADYVNANTTFSEDAADILNNSAFIQVYTDAKVVDGDIVLYAFKTYYNTGCKGNFTFSIQAPAAAAIMPDTVDTAEVKKKIDKIGSGSAVSTVRPKGAGPKDASPRERRK
jgi:hypothetical protein